MLCSCNTVRGYIAGWLLDRVLCGNVDGREEVEEEGEIAGGDKNKLSFIEAIAFDLDGQLVR